MGGMQGFGRTMTPHAGPPFAEPWEGQAFALGLLAIRASGANLHAFRHAIERVPPEAYLSGHYGRWLAALVTRDAMVGVAKVSAP
jgi:nitrile hydratase subunit beta